MHNIDNIYFHDLHSLYICIYAAWQMNTELQYCGKIISTHQWLLATVPVQITLMQKSFNVFHAHAVAHMKE